MKRIDFRSDTVTWPTPAMREAMARAELGDDVYGEDPTVNQLQEAAAAKVGKEAALFVASGTMGNLAAILSHTTRGDEAIVGEDAHTYRHEAGGMAAVGGVMPQPLPTDAIGRMDLEQLASAIHGDDPHEPRSRLILVENSYGARNGAPIPLDYFAAIHEIAADRGLAVHLDGARLFNAATALGVEAAALTQHVDSVSFCLSKGLCAPVGSLLCGSRVFIDRAHRARKLLGGGMRQAGVLAAAGLIALNEMSQRLDEDHRLACQLAEGLARIPGILVDPAAIQTNIVFFALADEVPLTAPEVVERLRQEANVWIWDVGPRHFRAVTHYWVGPEEMQVMLEAVANVIRDP